MRYLQKGIDFLVEPIDWNKNSGKPILQYAVGGLLYMPATNTKIADKLINRTFSLKDKYTYIKSMVLCLEDSIGDDMLGKAEHCLVNTLKTLYEALHDGRVTLDTLPLIFIRVRNPEHLWSVAKKISMYMSVITGFVFPKFDMTNCDEYIDNFMKIKAKHSDIDLYFMPIIESKNAMYRQLRMENLLKINDKLRLVNEYVLNIRVGCADFCNIFGIRRSIDQTVHDISVINDCLSDIINVFARNYVVSSGVWEYFGNSEEDDNGETASWLKGLHKELYKDRLNGFIGKTSIHPMQLKHIQQSLIVSEENYKDAMSILGTSDGLIGVAKGYGGNKMNETKTHSKWARKTVGLAEIYGVRKDV